MGAPLARGWACADAETIRYIEERSRFRERWIGALERLDIPVLVAWGEKDPVAVLAIAERLAGEIPGAGLVTWDDLGHYPQVEDAGAVVPKALAFWDALDVTRAWLGATARRR